MTDAFVTAQVRSMVKLHERCRLKPYIDTTGNITIGWGFNLTEHGITQDLADRWRDEKIATAISECRRAFPWFDGIDPVRKVALADMAYNMGLTRLLTFKRTLAAMEKKKWKTAAMHATSSLWYTQTKTRAVRIVQMIATGQWPSDVIFPKSGTRS